LVFLHRGLIDDSAHPASPTKIACKIANTFFAYKHRQPKSHAKNGLAILHTRIAIGTRYSETGRLRFSHILPHHAKFYPKSLGSFLDRILIGDFACAVFAGSHIFSAYSKSAKIIEFFEYAVLAGPLPRVHMRKRYRNCMIVKSQDLGFSKKHFTNI